MISNNYLSQHDMRQPSLCPIQKHDNLSVFTEDSEEAGKLSVDVAVVYDYTILHCYIDKHLALKGNLVVTGD